MGSWVRTITTPFKKVGILLNPAPRDSKKSQQAHDLPGMKLEGEVMACAYEDVQVMWSILDKSKSRDGNRRS